MHRSCAPLRLGLAGLGGSGPGATGFGPQSEKPMRAAVSRAHQVAPVLTVLSTGVMLYLLLGRAQ